MAKIEGFRIKNFKVLKDVTLGRLWNQPNSQPLTPMTAVIGKNGVGKSALFDAFGFLADALKLGVEEACDARGRGGFAKMRTQGETGPIEFEVYYREHGNARPITHEVAIAADKSGRPYVFREHLRQRRRGQKYGRPFSFLVLNNGRGVAWKGGGEYQEDQLGTMIGEALERDNIDEFVALIDLLKKEKSDETEFIELEDQRKLGIATLGALKQHSRISAFRRFIEGWYLSYFTPDAARSLPLAGPQSRLNVHGDNLGNVVQFMEREHPQRFQAILTKIAEKIPGIHKIDTERTNDDRLLLRFNDKGFQEPFYAQQVSDGTLKVFAYLLLLEDQTPPSFLCIEEPENGLYHKLLETLANEFREHARARSGSQVFVTTHQPYFVDALEPQEVWILEKGEDGFSTIRRASDDPIVNNMVEEGLPLGGLWYSDYLDAR
ncbi:MAG: AAA family ATPase [Gemmatimonadetes bacterium]|nr:AAA family ATPase [Gemmatimonadota bacterium]MYB71370.1 AAA family ATPase [Gemmatimonadota bacterium]